MILVTGGAYSGKKDYVRDVLGIAAQDITEGGSCSFEAALGARCISGYHELVKRLISEGKDPAAFTRELCERSPGAVIITDEVGCGVIPLERSERLWREQAGRCGCIISKQSELVVRLTLGTAQIIKDERS